MDDDNVLDDTSTFCDSFLKATITSFIKSVSDQMKDHEVKALVNDNVISPIYHMFGYYLAPSIIFLAVILILILVSTISINIMLFIRPLR